MADLPILWSFRRCPYAMRARLAVTSAGVAVELREVVLRDKPQAFLDTSASATVPALRAGDLVLDESLDIMRWALQQNDPDDLLRMPDNGWTLIETFDGPFKDALDHTKYATRYPELSAEAERETASSYLREINTQLEGKEWLFGARPTLADLSILPFVRQFAHTDRQWFDQQDWPYVIAWLDRFLASEDFKAIMTKYPQWTEGDAPTHFGA